MKRSATPTILLAVAALTACTGSGTDIGPRLDVIPDASSKVVVLDDQGRGVVAAVATIGAARAVTGRNGRGDFLATPRGRVLLTVDGDAAAATAGDHLGRLTIATTITADVPSPVWLPDLPGSAAVTLDLGTQPGAVDVLGVAGSKLTIAAGTSVGSGGGGPTVRVRLGELSPQHVPGDLPTPDSGAFLCSKVVCIDPADVTFAAAADLEVADDLGLGSGSAVLLHLDVATGEWETVAATATAAGGRITASGGVAGGGCYVFAVEVPAVTVSGRVLDDDGRALPDVMVAVDQRRTVTGGDGRFTIGAVPAALADASARQAALELFAGGSWLPARAATTVAVAAGNQDLGDLTLDTVLAGNIRVQQVVRGRADALRPARLSSLRAGVALAVMSDERGQAFFEDVPAEYFGFTQGRPIDTRELFYVQSVAYLERGRRWLDAYQFAFQRDFFVGTRSTRTQVTDALGGGPLQDADVVRGSVGDQGYVDYTRELGQLFVVRDFSGRATASQRSQRDGQVLVHAFSIYTPDADHLELPLQRLRPVPVAAFDRHGLVVGELGGADGGQQHALRTTRRLTAGEWWDDLAEGKPLTSSLPVDVDPAVTHSYFRAGVDANGGNLAAIEYDLVGADRRLLAAGVLADLVPTPGAVTRQDVALAAADTAFAAPGLLSGGAPLLDVSQLTFDLALQRPSGLVVDVGRDLRGSMGITGEDVTFTLPALTGAFADAQWLALVRADSVDGADELCYTSLVTLPVDTVRAVPGFPTITSPTNGGTAAASGFHVLYSLPAGAVYGTIELRSTTGGETLLWQAVVPPTLQDFEFVHLPSDAETPLLAGRTYTLTVTAWFGDRGLTQSSNPYRDITTFWQSVGTVERGITQRTARTITITTI